MILARIKALILYPHLAHEYYTDYSVERAYFVASY